MHIKLYILTYISTIYTNIKGVFTKDKNKNTSLISSFNYVLSFIEIE